MKPKSLSTAVMTTSLKVIGGWCLIAAAALVTHVAVELVIRGCVEWRLVMGSSLSLATAIVFAGRFIKH